jgi:2-amino-4-hydroxy-6-hydroxymethyldihydropteridine diphosphokinase
MRDWHLVGIGFGSNLGDREINIETAVSMLMEEGILCKCLSGVYKTKPVGFSSTNDFANAVGEKCMATEHRCRQHLASNC